MKVMVFGGGGQIGREVCNAAWPPHYDIASLDRRATDITDSTLVRAALARERPSVVINLAAYTAVDRAESEPEAAWAVNSAGAAHIAAACAETATPLIHLSTDYVFDGCKTEPYREDDPVGPLGVYGCSKEAGERAIRAALEPHIILRTAWVYGVYGANFVKTMLRLAGERPVVRVVADQIGCPTSAAEITTALIAIVTHIERGGVRWGTYHFAGAGAVSWYGFAEAIFELAATRLPARPRLIPIRTDEYPTAARRPMHSILDCGKIKAAFSIDPAPWRAALVPVIQQLLPVDHGPIPTSTHD
jgi:dTDP-4-dehydrorhamnose reductase